MTQVQLLYTDDTANQTIWDPDFVMSMSEVNSYILALENFENIFKAVQMKGIGTFNLHGLRKIKRVHQLITLKEEIKEVNEWFDNDIESPCNHCTSPDRIVIEECQALLNESNNGKVIFKPATVVADIASVCATQWMSLGALEMFTKIVNRECKIGKVLLLNKIHDLDQIKTDLTGIGKDSLQKIFIIMSIRKELFNGQTFLSH